MKRVMSLALGLGLVWGCNTRSDTEAERERPGFSGQPTNQEAEPQGDTGGYGAGQDQVQPSQPAQQPSDQPAQQPGGMGEQGGYGGDPAAQQGAQAGQSCDKLRSCFSSISQNLCDTADQQCHNKFSSSNLPNDEQQCMSRLSEVRTQIQPYVQAKPSFQLPSECQVSQ
jgi:hypothetical protein